MEGTILLEKMSVYQKQMLVTDQVWEIVKQWKVFDKNTIGTQLVRAFDSIGANIAEGYGRYHYGDKIKFYYYARGSAFESQYWIKRANHRGLIENKPTVEFLKIIQDINLELNRLIKKCKTNKSQS